MAKKNTRSFKFKAGVVYRHRNEWTNRVESWKCLVVEDRMTQAPGYSLNPTYTAPKPYRVVQFELVGKPSDPWMKPRTNLLRVKGNMEDGVSVESATDGDRIWWADQVKK